MPVRIQTCKRKACKHHSHSGTVQCYFLTLDISENYTGWISPWWSWMKNFKRFLSFSFPHCLIQKNISFCSCRSEMMTYSLEITSSRARRLRAKAVHKLLFCIYLLWEAGPKACTSPMSPGSAWGICLHAQGTKSCHGNSEKGFAEFYFSIFQPSWKEAQLLWTWILLHGQIIY